MKKEFFLITQSLDNKTEDMFFYYSEKTHLVKITDAREKETAMLRLSIINDSKKFETLINEHNLLFKTVKAYKKSFILKSYFKEKDVIGRRAPINCFGHYKTDSNLEEIVYLLNCEILPEVAKRLNRNLEIPLGQELNSFQERIKPLLKNNQRKNITRKAVCSSCAVSAAVVIGAFAFWPPSPLKVAAAALSSAAITGVSVYYYLSRKP